MTSRFFFTYLWREARGLKGRLVFFVLCLTVGVAAVVAVGGVTDALDSGIRQNARKLLAADLAVRSRRPIPDDVAPYLKENGAAAIVNIREMASMVSVMGDGDRVRATRLVELKVIDGPYPFYGEVTTIPARPFSELLTADGVVLAKDILDTLKLKIGESVRIGQGMFRITGCVLEEPDRLDFSLVLGPRAMISAQAFEAAKLGGAGSRVTYRMLARFDDDRSAGSLKKLRERLKKDTKDGATLDVDTFDEAQPAVRDALRRVADFLGLVALISLILGGVGVAETVRTWLLSRIDAIAVVRALGLRPGEVFRLYLVQVSLLAFFGCIIGVVIGSFCPIILTRLAPEFVPPSLVSFVQPWAWVRGLLTGIVIALVFAIPPLLTLRRVPCARVLRHDAEPLPASRTSKTAAALVVVIGVLLAARLTADSWTLAGAFTGALAAMAALLALSTRGVLWILKKIPRDLLRPTFRWGFASLARPAAGTTSVLLALGLGVFVVTTLSLVRTRLVSRLKTVLPEKAPSTFLVDIQPDQWPAVDQALKRLSAESVQAVPVAMARLSTIDGEKVEEIASRREETKNRARWVLTREQRLTWYEKLPDSNRLVEGELWSKPDVAEVSLEEKYARDLGVKIGSKIKFDVQGVPVELEVTSTRRVTWESFSINFFIVVEPGVLDKAPHFILAAARLDPDRESDLQIDVAQHAPNVTIVRVRAIIERVGELVKKLTVGVEIVGLFTFAAGLAILSGAIAAQTLRRRKEIAILKALGSSRFEVIAMLGAEFALLGLLAAFVGGVGGFAAAAAFIDRVFDIEPELPYGLGFVVLLVGSGTTAFVGLVSCQKALRAKPMEVLRE